MKEIKLLLKAALMPQSYADPNFSVQDVQTSAANALIEHFKINKEISIRELKQLANMAIIEEVIDEVLPAALEDILGQWAEIKSFGRDEEVKFTLKGIGKNRALLSIVPGSRGGVYKARRLDDRNLFIETKVYTAGIFVTLEEILLGKITLAELMDNILTGITFEIYKSVVAALRTAKTLAPAANRQSGAGVVTDTVDGVIRVIQQYGAPVIVAFQGLAGKFSNAQGSSNPNVSIDDVNDIRKQAFVSIYKGTPVIRIPNFLADELNLKWIFSEADAFILPSAGKLVKVALKGEGRMVETAHPSGSMEQNFHKMMGTGVLFYQNIGIYTDTDIEGLESGKTYLV